MPRAAPVPAVKRSDANHEQPKDAREHAEHYNVVYQDVTQGHASMQKTATTTMPMAVVAQVAMEADNSSKISLICSRVVAQSVSRMRVIWMLGPVGLRFIGRGNFCVSENGGLFLVENQFTIINPTTLPPPTDRLLGGIVMTTQLPSVIAARRTTYAKKLMQRRHAVKARRARERVMGRAIILASTCALAALLMFGLFLPSAN